MALTVRATALAVLSLMARGPASRGVLTLASWGGGLAAAAAAKSLSPAICVGTADVDGRHCVCLPGSRCSGGHCAAGVAAVHAGLGAAAAQQKMVYGYNPARCSDCSCKPDPKVIDAEPDRGGGGGGGTMTGPAGEPQHARAGSPCGADIRFPQYEPHTGEPGRGDVCKPTSAEITLEWGCPVGCTQSIDGELACKMGTEPCRAKVEYECPSTDKPGMGRWPIGIPRLLHFVRKELTPEERLQPCVDKTISMFQQESMDAGTVANDHIMIWSDVECEAVVTATFPGLVRWFNNESKGMYKADICRYAVLYQMGGLYVDDDIEFIESPWSSLQCDDQLVTATEKDDSGLFQAYLASRAGHPAILETLGAMQHSYEVGKGGGDNRRHLKAAANKFRTIANTGVRYLLESKLNSKDQFWKELGTNCNCVVRDSDWRVFFRSHVYPSKSCWKQPKWDFCTDNELPVSTNPTKPGQKANL